MKLANAWGRGAKTRCMIMDTDILLQETPMDDDAMTFQTSSDWTHAVHMIMPEPLKRYCPGRSA